MKKVLAILLSMVMLFSLVACGGGANKEAIIGTWKLVDSETEAEYGPGIEFTEDGKFRYGLTEDVFGNLVDSEYTDELMAGLDTMMTIEYEIKSNTKMELTVNTVFGVAAESEAIKYSLKGDTLVFGGVTYTRVK